MSLYVFGISARVRIGVSLSLSTHIRPRNLSGPVKLPGGVFSFLEVYVDIENLEKRTFLEFPRRFFRSSSRFLNLLGLRPNGTQVENC